MQRYFPPFGTGSGTDVRVADFIDARTSGSFAKFATADELVMREDPYGHWVRHHDADVEIRKQTALAESRQKQIDALKQSVKDFSAAAELTASERSKAGAWDSIYALVDNRTSCGPGLPAVTQALTKVFDDQKLAKQMVTAHQATYNAWVRTYQKLGKRANSPMAETEAEIDRLIAHRGAREEGPLQTRTSQLLNELYHDRARLENVIEDAVKIMEAAVDNLEDYQDEIDDVETGAVELVGHLKQFIDTHGGE